MLYQIYPRSFADSNGGVGDLRGLILRLDHLEWLGVDGIWLTPVTVSPDKDWGYDVADYCDVHPELGSLADVDELVAEAEARGMRMLIDLVPNHTSDRHAWFVESRASRDSTRRQWYVWADAKPDGSPPNNWISTFGGPAWTLDPHTGQYYLHNFLPEQPDLNWWHDGVPDSFDGVLRFWLDRGIAGFRIDVAHGIVKDRELRDNPPATESDFEGDRRLGQRPVYNANRPEVHDVHRRFRTVCDAYDPPGVLVGETWVSDLDGWAAYFGTGDDELQLAFYFPYTLAPLDTRALRAIVEGAEAAIGAGGWPAWTLSNHDIGRFPSRTCGGDEAKIRCALLALLTIRGTPVLYYGDEIGMAQAEVVDDERRDPVGRDGGRTPMRWTGEAGAGFTAPGVTPWLPLGDPADRIVDEQREDRGSTLHFCRDLIALRRESAELRDGSYGLVPTGSPDAWAWRRGDTSVVAVNLSGEGTVVEGVVGTVALATIRAREGEAVTSRLSLGPWEGALLTGTRIDATV